MRGWAYVGRFASIATGGVEMATPVDEAGVSRTDMRGIQTGLFIAVGERAGQDGNELGTHAGRARAEGVRGVADRGAEQRGVTYTHPTQTLPPRHALAQMPLAPIALSHTHGVTAFL